MATIIKNVNRNSNVEIFTEIEGIETSFTYYYTDSAPSQINVNGYYRSDGFSASINRVYTANEAFTPEANPIYNSIFTPEYEQSVKSLVSQLFSEYNTFNKETVLK